MMQVIQRKSKKPLQARKEHLKKSLRTEHLNKKEKALKQSVKISAIHSTWKTTC